AAGRPVHVAAGRPAVRRHRGVQRGRDVARLVLSHFGHGGASGYLIAIMTVGGIAGGALLPGFAARRDQRRGLLQVAVITTAAAFAGMAGVDAPAACGGGLPGGGVFPLARAPGLADWA